MKHPEFSVPTQVQVERKVKTQNLWWAGVLRWLLLSISIAIK